MKNQLVIFVLLSILLTACAPQVTATSEATVAPQSESTSATATPNAEEEIRASVIAQIQADPNYQSPYVQALEAVSGQSIPETCADFAVKLGTLEDVTITLDSFANCVILANDGSQAIYPMPNGEFLYVTAEGGRAFLEAQGVDAAGAVFSVDPSSPFYGEMRDADGRRLTVATRSTRQWRLVNEAGQVLNDAGDVLVMPTAQAPTGEGVAEVRLINEAALKLLVEKYLNAPFDISTMTLDQANAFRTALAEHLKPACSVHVTFDAGGSNPAYIDPETFTMRQLNDGRSEAAQRLQMCHEVQVDAEGSLWVTDMHGERVRIDGSAGVDWNAIIDNPQSTEVVWPTVQSDKNSNLPDAQRFLTWDQLYSKDTAYQRVVLLDKTKGQLFLKEFSGGAMVDTLRFYQIIADKAGNPLYAQVFLASPAGRTNYLEEGSDVQSQSMGSLFPENGGMLPLMEENSVYYIGIETNQAEITSYPNSSSGYSGVVSENVSGEVLLGTKTDQKNLLFILMRMLIKAKP